MEFGPVQQKVIKILANTLNLDPKKITLQSRLAEDLGVDSFSAIEIMFNIEEEFNIKINEEEMLLLKTVEEIITHILKKVESG